MQDLEFFIHEDTDEQPDLAQGTAQLLRHYVILKPGYHPARTGVQRCILGPEATEKEQTDAILSAIGEPGSIVAFDLETRGTRPFELDNGPVGIGLAGPTGYVYLTVTDCTMALVRRLVRGYRLIAHNLAFDSSWFLREQDREQELPIRSSFYACTYLLTKLLATEGWTGQQWGLKQLQKELLGWTETNELELDDWLVQNGYKNQSGRPLKSEMWRAPPEILGRYCALDAEACYLLYVHILEPALQQYYQDADLQLYLEAWREHVLSHAEQYIQGLTVNLDGIRAYQTQLQKVLEQKERTFLEHPDIQPHVQAFNAQMVQELKEKEPERYLVRKLGKEPARLKKDGSESVTWRKWNEKRLAPPVQSKNWERWKQKYDEAQRTQHFNIGSTQQRTWLFYECLKYPVELRTKKSDAPAVDNKAMMLMGEHGRLFNDFAETSKELSYVASAADIARTGEDRAFPWQQSESSIITGPAQGTFIHPGYKVPGTTTGRLAGGGGFNFQQQPKTWEYLEQFKARPGTVWVDCDFTALEPMVLTELSKDRSLWTVYGPGAPTNDIYLFTGAGLPKLGDAFRSVGYVPDRPTPEALQQAKKQFKTERSIAKLIHLAASYGAGAAKIQMSLRLNGIQMSLYEVKRMLEAYWKLYAGVKEMEKELERVLERTGGWVLNGMGRPLGVASGKEKDVVNRVVQSTGHDVLVLWANDWTKELTRRRIPWRPVIRDYHDQSIVEVPESAGEEVRHVLGEFSMKRLNDWLEWEVPLRGEAQVVRNLAEAKAEKP